MNNAEINISKELIEQSLDGIIISDEHGNIATWNSSMESITGIQKHDTIGKPLWEVQSRLIPVEQKTPELLEQLQSGLKNILELKMDWPGESREQMIACTDGTRKTVQDSSFIIKTNTGMFFGSIIRDITDRKLKEEEIKASEDKYRLLVENLNEGIWYIDKDSHTTYVNQHMAEMLGYTVEEMQGKHLFSFMDERGVELAKYNLERRQKGIKEQHEFEFVRKDSKRIFVQLETAPIIDNKGQYNGAIAGAQDITAKKISDEEHRQYELRLQQTQKLESLGLLAGGIAHDFNNLMGGIFGYMDMAREETKEGKVTSYLSKAMNTIDRARGLTAQLLTFAKGGAPVQQIGNLFPFVQETAKFALSGANVSCHFDVPKDLWACNFDKNQIGQVIDNLIINAQQAMPVGGAIELTARNITLAEKEHPLLANGHYIKISVKDSGVGIPKEHISKIFDPFFTTKAKGHGLGLATCYSITNRHGGCIDVESEPGKGSTFKIYLPATTESASSEIKKSDKTHKGSGTFLIMDDEEVMRDTIGDMLETLGYSVVSKENGKDAIDFFATETKANRKITGIIFDLTVPGGMGGKAAIEEIRKLNKDIPAFVASGYADDPVMKKPVEHGFSASICKPFRKSELSEMLNKYMQTKK